MKTALSCLFSLALYLALAGGLAFLIERRTGELKPALIVGAIAGLFAAGIFGNLIEAVKKLLEGFSLLRFLGNREPLDGERFVAIGPIEASGLHGIDSPLTQSPAVAYSYRIVSGGSSWEGWGMAACRIQAGPHSVRLLAFPDLAFPQRRYATETAIRKAEEFLQRTTFESADSFELARVSRDEGGSLQRDVGPGEKPASLKGAILTEKVVLPGDVVSAAGTYSAARGGLVVDPTAKSWSVTLRKGEPRPAPLFTAAFGKVVQAVFLFAIVSAGLIGLFFFFPLDAAEERDASIRSSWLEARVENLLDERLRPAAAQASIAPLLMAAPGESLRPGEARGRIRTAQGDAAVMHAIADRKGDGIIVVLYSGDSEVAQLTLAGGGDLRRVDLAGASVSAAALPASSFAFAEFGPDDIGGRLSFLLPDGPAARVRFRATVAGLPGD